MSRRGGQTTTAQLGHHMVPFGTGNTPLSSRVRMQRSGYEVYRREVGEEEVALIALSPKREYTTRSPDLTPEEILLAREALADEDRRTRRKLSREMTRALVWMGTEDPDRVRRMIDRFLPIEEAYMLRRYLLHRDCEEAIGQDMGITGQGVGYRLYRALWRLRMLQEIAWDLSAADIRAATSECLATEDVDVVAALWSCSFSRSKTAAKLGTKQQRISDAMSRAIDALADAAGKTARRIRDTLLEVRRRKLWMMSSPMPCHMRGGKPHAVRMPA